MLSLNEHGLLPPGVHDLSIEDIGKLFANVQGSERREQLFRKLEELIDQVRSFDFMQYLIVDGSFVTAKAEPEDIDLVLVVNPSILTRSGLLNPFEYNALSARRLRKRYSFDVFVVPDGSEAYHHYVEFFSRVKDGNPGGPKGIVLLRLQ